MRRLKKIFLLYLLIINYRFVFSQNEERKINTHVGIFTFAQLSSTKYATGITVEYGRGKNLFYIGAKIPIPLNDLNVIGANLGYGRQLIGNKILKVNFIPDIQWINSKTQNQTKPTQYFDFTFNYELSYVKIKNLAFGSSFGYGFFLKRYYRNDLKEMQSSSGLSGLIRLRITYFIINKIHCRDCPSVH